VRRPDRLRIHVRRLPQDFDPVSCPDGNTYNNACIALCAGQAGCQSTCPCPRLFDPVTCPDGSVYNNACLAECAGKTGCTPACQ